MIIECFCKKKKFEIDTSLIPSIGRKLQCGSCNHVWYYKPEKIKTEYSENPLKENQINIVNEEIKEEKTSEFKKNIKSIELKNYTKINISKILSYIIVFLVSFAALIILLDTFKSPLIVVFPKLELFLYNFFETLKDFFLFSKNLIM